MPNADDATFRIFFRPEKQQQLREAEGGGGELIVTTHFDQVEGMDDTNFSDEEENTKRMEIIRKGKVILFKLSEKFLREKSCLSVRDNV